MAAALALHRHREDKDKYPYNASTRFAAQYKDGRWLHMVSNLPKAVVEGLNEAGGSGSGKSVEKVKMDDLMKESKKYREKKEKRKKLKAPSTKDVREHLQHMVDFSTSHYEAEFKSAYPLLGHGGKVLEESDSDNDGGGEGGENKRGVVDKVKNAKKLHEAMIRGNPDIPMHRK